MQSSMQLNQGSNQHYKPSKSSLNKNFKHIDPKNTHTHTKQVSPFLYLKNKLRQFSEHTLTHVKPCDSQITLYLHMYQK